MHHFVCWCCVCVDPGVIGIHVLDHGGRIPMSMEACQHGSILEEVHLHSTEIIITSSHHNTHRSTVQYSTVQYSSTPVRQYVDHPVSFLCSIDSWSTVYFFLLVRRREGEWILPEVYIDTP
jgi:hypothetical protein